MRKKFKTKLSRTFRSWTTQPSKMDWKVC